VAAGTLGTSCHCPGANRTAGRLRVRVLDGVGAPSSYKDICSPDGDFNEGVAEVVLHMLGGEWELIKSSNSLVAPFFDSRFRWGTSQDECFEEPVGLLQVRRPMQPASAGRGA